MLAGERVGSLQLATATAREWDAAAVIRAVVAILLLLAPLAGMAHQASDSFIFIEGEQVRLDLALRDLLQVQNLDVDGDGHVRWGELQSAEPGLRRYLAAHLQLLNGSEPCALSFTLVGPHHYQNTPYAVWKIQSPCLQHGGELQLNYRILFATDPGHRALYRLSEPWGRGAGALSPLRPSLEFGAAAPSPAQTFKAFFQHGIMHLLIGYDHLAFLLVLVLPVLNVHRRTGSALATLRELAVVVTMFTAAHSMTLAAATLGWLALPARLVEVAIAASITLAAGLAFAPRPHVQRYLALGFGLVHGLGFAGVLAELLSQDRSLLLALISFNLGVEVAQLALVVLSVALLYPLRQHWLFARVVSPLSLGLMAAAGLYWALLRL